jgi:hypothetical protein
VACPLGWTEKKQETHNAPQRSDQHSNDQTNCYVFEPSSKGTKMTITMDYEMNKLLDVLVAHRMIEKVNMETLEKLKDS